jgi:subtilisin
MRLWYQMLRRILIALIGLFLLTHAPAYLPAVTAQTGKDIRALLAQAQSRGAVRVIVGVRVNFQPEGRLTARAAQTQRVAIAQAQNALLTQFATRNLRAVRTFASIPYLAMTVDANTLTALAASANVTMIREDKPRAPSLAESTELIGAPAAWASGYSGAGQTVAILDTGVDSAHPFLASKVISEACYSTNDAYYQASSVCPGGVTESTAPGSGIYCDLAIYSCRHGTHVAGIAAGKDPGGLGFSGVARDANLIAIQVFSRFDSTYWCGGSTPCILAFDSDIVKGLERVYDLRNTYPLAAANLSLGGSLYSSQAQCDADFPDYKNVMDNLRSVGIATVVASGNDYSSSAIGAPACVSSAVSVGATLDGGYYATPADAVASFSNSASFLSLLAPGQYIYSSFPNNSYNNWAGTSMATPHVTGAWAVIKSRSPTASVEQVLNALTSTGVPITDGRNGVTTPRIRLNNALGAVPPFIYFFPMIFKSE